MKQTLRIRELINRLARMDAMQGWEGDLNPTQVAMLSYLKRANRFSRSPSHVADYLGITRGTTSQSLKSLSQKGYVEEHRSAADKRVIHFELTAKGQHAAETVSSVETALSHQSHHAQQQLEAQLETVLRTLLRANGGRAFGQCNSCRHHEAQQSGGFCTLLAVSLTPDEGDQICYEQEFA